MVKDKTSEQLYRQKQIDLGNKTLYKWVPSDYHAILSEILSSPEEIKILIANYYDRRKAFYESEVKALRGNLKVSDSGPLKEASKSASNLDILDIRDRFNFDRMSLRISECLNSDVLKNKEIAQVLKSEGFRTWNYDTKKFVFISSPTVGRIRKDLEL